MRLKKAFVSSAQPTCAETRFSQASFLPVEGGTLGMSQFAKGPIHEVGIFRTEVTQTVSALRRD